MSADLAGTFANNLLTATFDRPREDVGHLDGVATQYMGVGPKRDRGVLVAESVRYDVRGYSGEQQGRRVRMAKIMKSKPRNACRLAQLWHEL